MLMKEVTALMEVVAVLSFSSLGKQLFRCQTEKRGEVMPH